MKTQNISALNQVLADSYALAIKTQNYHWNVTGPNFSSLHSLFETQYDDLLEAIDRVAERIRALGAKVESSLALFNAARTVSDPLSSVSSDAMLKDLVDSQEKMLITLKNALAAAQAEADEATADLLIQRITEHDKQKWMLNSTVA